MNVGISLAEALKLLDICPNVDIERPSGLTPGNLWEVPYPSMTFSKIDGGHRLTGEVIVFQGFTIAAVTIRVNLDDSTILDRHYSTEKITTRGDSEGWSTGEKVPNPNYDPAAVELLRKFITGKSIKPREAHRLEAERQRLAQEAKDRETMVVLKKMGL